MKGFIKAIDDLPLIVKIIFCLPAVDIIWNVYRLCKSIDKNNTVGVVLAAIMLLVFSWNLLWLVDLICILLNGKIWWLD